MNENKKLEEQVLVFSSSDTIFVLDNDKTIKEIASRENGVNVLCSHNGKLYDGGWDYKIFETLSNTEITSTNKVIGTERE